MAYRTRNLVRLGLGLAALALATLFVLVQRGGEVNWLASVVTALATAAIFNLPVPLATDERPLVHVVGLAALLFFDPAATIAALTVGLLIGVAVRASWRRAPAFQDAPAFERSGRGAFEVSQSLFSHMAAILAYQALGGGIPIGTLSLGNVVPVVGFVLAHLAVEGGLFALHLRLRGAMVTRLSTEGLQLGFALTELVPLPFVLFAAALLFRNGLFPLVVYPLLCVLAVAVIRHYGHATIRAERRYRELASLSNVSRALRTSLDLGALLDMIYLQVAHLLRIEDFYVALYNPGDDILSFAISVRGGQRARWPNRPAANRLTDHVINTGAPLLITHDVRGYLKRMGMDLDGDIPNAWMGVPLTASDRAIGCMAVLTYNPGETFSPDALSTFSALAAQAGVAIENAQLYGESQRRTAELRSLTEISSLLSSTLNPDQVLEYVSNSVLQVFDSQKSAIFLLQENRQELFLARAEGMSDAYLYASRTLPLSATGRVQAVISGEPHIVSDISKVELSREMRELARAEGFRAYVDMPLRAQGETIGFLAIYFHKPRRFRLPELQLLKTFASQAALAVANARMYANTDKALARKVVQLQALEELGRELTSTLDVERLFDMILVRAMESTFATAGALALWDEAKGGLRLVAQRGYEEAMLRDLSPDGFWPTHQGIMGRVQRTGQTALVPDVRADPDFVQGSLDTQSQLSVPIQREAQTLGVITLESDQPAAFSAEDGEFVSQLAVQAAVALANAQLYQSAQQRLRELSVLYEASAELASTLDTRGILEAVAAKMVSAVGANFCAISELDPMTRTVHVVAGFGRDGECETEIGKVFSLDAYPATRRVLTDRETLVVRIDDPAADQAEKALLRDVGGAVRLAMPMIASDRAIGLIEIYDRTPHDFSENEMRLLQTLATQAGVAFENAQLFERVTEGRDRLAAILNSTREGVLMIDGDGRVALANPRIEEFWGVRRETLIGQPLDELAARQDLALDLESRLGFMPGEVDELMDSLRRGAVTETRRIPFRLDEPAHRFLERTDSPVVDDLGRVIGRLIVLRDVTEEKELEETREDLANMIIHDLRSPMTSVLGSLRLMEDILPTQDTQGPIQQAIEVGVRSSQRLLTLVDSLLDISRLEAGRVDLRREPVPLRPLVDTVMAGLNSLAVEQDIRLQNEIPSDLVPLCADRDKVERIFVNLIDNALKFTPPGGDVTVQAEVGPAPANGNRYVLVSVSDDGPGIPEDYRERVFDRFAQVRGRQGRRRGTGLGLAFCKLAVEAHGGEIWVDNRPEGGSAFRFRLPAMEERDDGDE